MKRPLAITILLLIALSAAPACAVKNREANQAPPPPQIERRIEKNVSDSPALLARFK